jgi:hypothetical protein
MSGIEPRMMMAILAMVASAGMAKNDQAEHLRGGKSPF